MSLYQVERGGASRPTPLRRRAPLRGALRGCGPAPRGARFGGCAVRWPLPAYCSPGSPGLSGPTPAHCPCALRCSGLFGMRASARPPAPPGPAHYAPGSGGPGCGCACRRTAAPGNQSPGLLPCLPGARPARRLRGAAAPRPARCAAPLRRCGDGLPRHGWLPVWLRPCSAAPGPAGMGRACLAAGLLPPCRRRPGGRHPPRRPFSRAAPARGARGCGWARKRAL